MQSLEKSMKNLTGIIKGRSKLVAKTAPKVSSEYLSRRGCSEDVHQASLELAKFERKNGLNSSPLSPGSEFPTIFTRIPLFLPMSSSAQKNMMDEDTGIHFSTSWGHGRRLGPPLSIYDEDTLMAISALRSRRLSGLPRSLPIPMGVASGHDYKKVSCHALHCLVTEIQRELNLQGGGGNNKRRLDSIRRLSATTVELITREAGIERGKSFRLISVDWISHKRNAVLYIQFSPLVSELFEKSYTYIDLNIRMKLSDTGKAIHRFLSGQPKTYKIGIRKLMDIIHYSRAQAYFSRDIRVAMELLKDADWISDYEITGNGRTKPFMISIFR